MGSLNAPFGLRPQGRFNSGSLEVFQQYPIASGYATSIAAGDLVQLVDGGTATTIEKQSATGNTTTDIAMVGVFVGCTYTNPSTQQLTFDTLWPAGTAAADAMAYVVTDPDATYSIQASAAITNPLDVFSKNAGLVQTAPSTVFKISRVALDVASLSNDANLPVRIVDYVGGARGDERGTAFPILLVKLNYTQFSVPTGV